MAKRYLVTYDLNQPGQAYEQLWDALRRMGAKRALESLWVLQSTSTAEQLREYFWQYMDSSDAILVCAMDEWASRGTKIKISET